MSREGLRRAGAARSVDDPKVQMVTAPRTLPCASSPIVRQTPHVGARVPGKIGARLFPCIGGEPFGETLIAS